MAAPIEIQTASVSVIKAALPELATCKEYAGEFSAGELQRASVLAPAVLVACLGGTRVGEVDDGGVDWMYRFVAYCMVRGVIDRNHRAGGALGLASAVIAAIDKKRFGLTGVWPAKVTRMENLYAEAWDKASIALWAVTWEQQARIAAVEDWVSGVRPEEIYLGFAPEIGAAHEADYVKVWPNDDRS